MEPLANAGGVCETRYAMIDGRFFTQHNTTRNKYLIINGSYL